MRGNVPLGTAAAPITVGGIISARAQAGRQSRARTSAQRMAWKNAAAATLGIT